MSVTMKILFPWGTNETRDTFKIKDNLLPDQDYVFYGHIIDMGEARCEDDENIPKKPSVDVIEMTQAHEISHENGVVSIPGKQEFYLCRAGQFKKLPVIETTPRNNAIVAFLQALEAESFVIIKMSW